MAIKKKILFLSPTLKGGGAERFLTIILRHVDRRKFASVLGVVSKVASFVYKVPPDIEVVDLKSRRVRYALFKIVRLVRVEKPDIVFCTLGHLNIAVILFRFLMNKKIKFVVRETNIPSINLQQSSLPRLLPFLYRRLYPKVGKVICQSNDMSNDLVRSFGLSRNQIVVINNPVDVDEIAMRSNCNKVMLLQNTFNILAAGKLKYQKGFDLLLRSMAYIRSDKFHLTILGQGPEENYLKKLARELRLVKIVTFAGFVENPYAFMTEADLFVLSSRFEGFPNVVLEAMACGTSVVAFECPGGINEIIEEGVNGWKVSPEDTRALARAIETAMKTPLDTNLIRKSVQERFGVEKIVHKYEKVFLEVLNS